jgi:hypothetical protein
MNANPLKPGLTRDQTDVIQDELRHIAELIIQLDDDLQKTFGMARLSVTRNRLATIRQKTTDALADLEQFRRKNAG